MRLRHRLIVFLVLSLLGCRGLHDGQTQRTFGEITDDSLIVTTVNAHVLRSAELSFFDVSAEAHRGNVILYGNVTSTAAEKELVGFCRNIKGVKAVQSRLIVIPPAPVH